MTAENALLLKSALAIATKIKAEAVVVHVDPLEDAAYSGPISRKFKLILASRKKRVDADGGGDALSRRAKAVIQLPKISLTRTNLIKVATLLAMSKELISPGSTIVLVVGDGGALDLIQVVDTSKESEFIAGKGISKISETVPPEVFQTVLNLSIELADKGREGKPVGTIFVVGDHEKVLQLSKQMIMNPFKGYDEEERNILSSALKETVREFSTMDGAFIISDDGTILTSGRYLGAAIDESSLQRGLGSRHIAAAGITSLTRAIAFVISESSGDVRIFKDGRVIMHIEKAPTSK
jgi:DNA integrity scanning protein DisA with diadenylate cyclase activity